MRIIGPLCIALAACGLSVIGEGPDAAPASADAAPPISNDGSVAADGSTPTIDAALDAPPTEAGPTCTPMTVNAGVVTAGHANAPFTIDGDLADWGCTTFHTFDGSNGGTREGGNSSSTYAFAAAWDVDNLYFAFRVTDATTPRGVEPDDVWKNDSIELYIATARRVGYAATDHCYIVDWQGRTNEFNNPAGRHAPGAGFAQKAVTNASGMTIEMRVARAELGLATLATTSELFVDFGGNDLQANSSDVWTTWYRETSCGCTIDKQTSGFGALKLVP